jgi:xanthine/uracil permease
MGCLEVKYELLWKFVSVLIGLVLGYLLAVALTGRW